MAAGSSGYLSIAEVERFLAFYPPDLRDIALELRNIVFSVCPSATERILWGGLSYHDSAKGGPVKGAICQIEIKKHRVHLGFIHGACLHDRDSLLTGERLSKRYLVIDFYDTAPWTAIRELIEEAVELNPKEFGELPPSGNNDP